MLMTVSPRHAKGLLTLLLVVLSETVSVSEAVSSWKKLHLFTRQHETEECPAATAGKTGSKLLVSTSSASTSSARGARHQSTASSCDCCASCVAGIPRGGHSAHHHGLLVDAASNSQKLLPYGIPLYLWKILFQAFLTALNVFFWLVPLRSPKMTDNPLALGLANAFSAGVFLSLAFGHLIPECVHGLHNSAVSLPPAAPYFMVLAGYLLIFFVEKVAFDAHGALHQLEHGASATVNGTPANVRSSSTNKNNKHDHHRQQLVPTTASSSKLDTSNNSGRSAVILLGALAVHSILEMMALGLADSFGDCALLTLSIALHQPAESIALLVAFLKSGMEKHQIIKYLSIFSCMGPIGVCLGMAVNEYAAPVVDSIMLALVAGTFVYVGATEIIPEEWEHPEHKWKKFAALLSGIVTILCITQFATSLDMFI